MIDRLVVTVITMVLCLFLALQLLIYGLTLFRQQQMDMICHKYALLMEKEAGLGQQEIAELTGELDAAGFIIESISASQQVDFGDYLQLQVRASWPAYRLLASWQIEEVELIFAYNTEIICRKISD